MLGFCTDYLATLPELVIYMNCDTRLALNLRAFNLSEYDELVFVIKNYSYLDSSNVFLFRAHKRDEDANGDVIFKITPEVSKKLKPGAFYTIAVLSNVSHPNKETEYKKLTDNGKLLLEYGAQDLSLDIGDSSSGFIGEIIGVRLEAVTVAEEQ